MKSIIIIIYTTKQNLSVCSGISDNGHSEKQATSVERTNCLPPTDCNIIIYKA